MIPYFKKNNNILYFGDAFDISKRVKPNSVHCCVTSPPYWGLRLYGTQEEIEELAKHPENRELGLEDTPEEYIQHLVQIFREIRKVLHPTGTVWLNIDDTHCVPSTVRESILKMKPGVPEKNLIGIPHRLVKALQADGWNWRQTIIWEKRNAPREPVRDRPTTEHEYVFLLTKNPHYYYNHMDVLQPLTSSNHYVGDREKVILESGGMFHAGHLVKAELTGRNLGTVWDIPTEGQTDPHYAAFPEKLAMRCIKAGSSKKGCCNKCFAPIRHILRRKDDNYANKLEITGWEPTCNCENNQVIPCTVLDPFMGRGTTALASEKLNRKWIGIEIYYSSCELIKQNIINRKLGLKPTKKVEDGLLSKDEINNQISG